MKQPTKDFFKALVETIVFLIAGSIDAYLPMVFPEYGIIFFTVAMILFMIGLFYAMKALILFPMNRRIQ